MFKIISTIVGLIGFIWIYETMERVFYPPQPMVVDLCDPKNIQQNTTQPSTCRWVVPAKYRIYSDLPNFFEVSIPWRDIDPTFPRDSFVDIQFWPDNSNYVVRTATIKNFRDRATVLKKDMLSLDTDIYFIAFDEIEVLVSNVFGISRWNGQNPLVRLYRPLGSTGTLHMMVSMPKLQSEAAFNQYVQEHIVTMDRQIMQFIEHWH